MLISTNYITNIQRRVIKKQLVQFRKQAAHCLIKRISLRIDKLVQQVLHK